MSRAGHALAALALLGAAPAAADRTGERLIDIAQLWSSEIGDSVGDLTFELVQLDFDVRKGVTRLAIGGGTDDLALRIDSDIRMLDGWARVQARVDLRLAGNRLSFDLPDVDLTSHTIYGERAVVVKVPLLQGKF
jgi:hypothetical protein